MSMATPCTADMGEGRGSSPEVLVRLGWWCGGDSVPCRVDAVPCRAAAEKKACFHFIFDDHDGLVASGLMALVTAVGVVTRRRLDGGGVTAQARCSEAKRARRRGRDSIPVRGHDDDGVGARARRGCSKAPTARCCGARRWSSGRRRLRGWGMEKERRRA